MEEQVQSQNSQAVTERSAGVRYGLIGSLVGIIYFVVLANLGIDVNEGPGSWLRIVITIVFIVLAHKYFKDNGSGYMSYGQGMSIIVWFGLISSVIGSLFFYMYVKFIDTGFIEAMKNVQITKMQEKGMSAEQIDQAMSFSSVFFKPEVMLGMGLVIGFIITLIVGLIVCIFTQKKEPVRF